MIAVQSKSPSLAGMITIDNVSSAPIFTNLGAVESLGSNQNATNIDVSSRLMPFYIPQSQGCKPCRQYPKHFGDSHSAKESAQCDGSEHRLNICPMFEFSYPTLRLCKQYRNRDLYGEAAGDVLTSQDIEKDSISDSTISKHLKWDCHYHLDNNAEAKIITAAYCQQSKPCYIFLSAAKSADGIGVPDSLSAIHDAPSVFFCVVGIAQPFFSNADIMRVAYQVMVGCSGAEKSAPVSDNAGYANPVQSTTSEIGVSGGGINYQLSEAAKWLLP